MKSSNARGYIPPRPDGLDASGNHRRSHARGPRFVPEETADCGEQRITGSRNAATAFANAACWTPTIQHNLGWGTVHKFLDWNIVEYCMSVCTSSASQMEPAGSSMARETLGCATQASSTRSGAAFINTRPTGTGSTRTTRNSLQFQAENLRVYSVAYARWGDPRILGRTPGVIRRLHEGVS